PLRPPIRRISEAFLASEAGSAGHTLCPEPPIELTPVPAGRRTTRATAKAPAAPQVRLADDRFFRHVVSSMRNGVMAIRRDGAVALMNDEAYRIFSLTRGPDDAGRPFTEVLRERPDVIRVLASAFELSHLPNRAELRLKDVDRVIGYTLSQVKDDQGR